jgi:hypothetical protein
MATLAFEDTSDVSWSLEPRVIGTEDLSLEEIYIERERYYSHCVRALGEMVLHKGTIGTSLFWKGVSALENLPKGHFVRVLHDWAPAEGNTFAAWGQDAMGHVISPTKAYILRADTWKAYVVGASEHFDVLEAGVADLKLVMREAFGFLVPEPSADIATSLILGNCSPWEPQLW